MPLTRPRRSSATRSTGPEEEVSAATDIINATAPTEAKPTVQSGVIPLDALLPNRFQKRKIFKQENIEALAESIKEDGQLQPIVVQPYPGKSGFYEIVAGERRVRACQLAGLTGCKAEIYDFIPDHRVKIIGMVENAQRENLTPLEKAEAYASLLEEREDDKPVYSERTLAKALNVPLSDIDNHLAVLKAPSDLREALAEDPDIPARIIRELSAIQDEERRKRILSLYRSDALKYDDVFSITREIKKEQGPKRTKETMSAAADTSLPNAPLADLLQTDPLVGRKVLERRVQKANKTFYTVLTPLAEDIKQLSAEDRIYVLGFLEDWLQKIRATVEQVPQE